MNKRVRFPCTPECEDRSPDCHGSCVKYLEARRKHDEKRTEVLAALAKDQTILDLEFDSRRRRANRKREK